MLSPSVPSLTFFFFFFSFSHTLKHKHTLRVCLSGFTSFLWLWQSDHSGSYTGPVGSWLHPTPSSCIYYNIGTRPQKIMVGTADVDLCHCSSSHIRLKMCHNRRDKKKKKKHIYPPSILGKYSSGASLVEKYSTTTPHQVHVFNVIFCKSLSLFWSWTVVRWPGMRPKRNGRHAS